MSLNIFSISFSTPFIDYKLSRKDKNKLAGYGNHCQAIQVNGIVLMDTKYTYLALNTVP